MDIIDGNVASAIGSFLVLHKRNLVRKINRTFHEALFGEYKKGYKAHRTYIETMYPAKLIKLMGGIHAMTLYPVLVWRNRFHNGTGYIDSILNRDMPYPIMVGTDDHQRVFISFKTRSANHNGKEYIAVDTLFQRHGDLKNTWTTGSRYYSRLFQEFGYFMVKGAIKHRYLETNISNIVNDRGYILQKNNDTCSDFGLGIEDISIQFRLCQ
jgi:hypothetical protein